MLYAWSKFHLFKGSLTNKHVDVKLRLRLFNSVVTPSALYGLTTAPLTEADFEKLAVAQRRMLRRIIGWSKLPDQIWEDVYRTLKKKLANGKAQVHIRDWNDELRQQKRKFHQPLLLNKPNSLCQVVFGWIPHDAKRPRGRPYTRWI